MDYRKHPGRFRNCGTNSILVNRPAISVIHPMESEARDRRLLEAFNCSPESKESVMPSPLRMLIVENDFVTMDTLRDELCELGYIVAADAMTIAEAEQALQKLSIDFAILDINLQSPHDGIILGQHIKERYGIPFVYLTAYSDSATISSAARTHPYGYIIKPFSAADLQAAIEVALQRREAERTEHAEKPVFIKDGENFFQLKASEIRYVTAYRNYLEINCVDQKCVIRSTLKEFKERLPEDSFFQPHRSFLVNAHHVKALKKDMLLMGEISIPVSRKGRDIVQDFFSHKQH